MILNNVDRRTEGYGQRLSEHLLNGMSPMSRSGRTCCHVKLDFYARGPHQRTQQLTSEASGEANCSGQDRSSARPNDVCAANLIRWRSD